MKTTLLSILTILFLSSFILSSFTQDYNQWHLPEGAIVRLGKGEINDIQYSSDGTRLAVASAIGVWLYDMATYQELDLLTGDVDPVKSIDFSADGRTLASKSKLGPIRLWDARTGQEKKIIKGHTIARPAGESISFSPDGLTVATGSGDGTIRLWDTTTGAHLRTFTGQTESVTIVSFSPDGRMIASATSEHNIHLWDAVTGAYKWTLIGHTNLIIDVSFSPDGRTLASGSWDDTICLWDTLTGANKHTLTAGKYHDVYRVSFSPNGKTLVSGGYRAIHFWNPVNGQLEETIRDYSGSISGISFSPNGAVLAGSDEGEIRFWDVRTRQHIKSITGHSGSIVSLTFSPDGQMIANRSRDKIHLWNAGTGAHLDTLTGHTSNQYYKSVSFSPDGRTLAAGGSTSRTNSRSPIDFWDIVTGVHLRSLTGSLVSVYSIAFSPDGRTLASGGYDKTVRLWDVVTGTRLHTLAGHADRVNSVVFNPDGQILASGSRDGTIRFWNARTGDHLRTLVGHRWVDTVDFSPNGQILASLGSREIRLWNAKTGVHLQTFIRRAAGEGLSFSPDGRTLASAGLENTGHTVHLWDVTTGLDKKTFNGHTGSIYSLAFSPDGQTLASGSYDGTVLLWDLTPSTHADTVISISPSPVHSSAIGQQFVLSLNITAGKNVAGYQANVQFDASILRYVSSANGDYLPAGAFAVPAVAKGNTVALAATSLAGESNGDGTLATITLEVVAVKASIVTLSDVLLTNRTGRSSRPRVVVAKITAPPRPDEDVNSDGVVNIQDLVLVAANFGQKEQSKADINADGVVNIVDLTLVAAALGNAAGAPSLHSSGLGILTVADVQQWLQTARRVDFTTPAYQRGVLMLEQLLEMLTPKETALLANYPNPFNPETWIPYQLVEPTNVTISIYSADGKLVRVLVLGHQPTGIYESRSRAAYWDGKNALGESVASGVYFYTLTAGDFTATRKMLIRK